MKESSNQTTTTTNTTTARSRWHQGVMVCLCMSLVLVVCFLPRSIVAANKKKKSGSSNAQPITLTQDMLNLCPKHPAITNRADQKILKWLIEESGKAVILMTTTPQHMAACWMFHYDSPSFHRGKSKDAVLQRYAIATLHFATTHSNTKQWDWAIGAGDDPNAAKRNGNWLNVRKHECQWYGVICEKRSIPIIGRPIVTALALGFLKLDGLLPRELSLLKDLKELDLHGNDLQGVMPHKMVDALSQLTSLRLHMNGIFGSLHEEIKGLKSLEELAIFGNYMAGTLPGPALAQLTQLTSIDMYANFFSGTIPSELGALKKLEFLDLHDNNLIGTVPKSICDLKLKELVVDCLGPKPEVTCACCTTCCRGLPDAKCFDMKSGREVQTPA